MRSSKSGTGFINKKNDPEFTVSHLSQECLLKGKPIVENLEQWCIKHNRYTDGIKPMLAVIYFDTGKNAQEYLHIKAEVAAKAGIGYTSHKLLPNASINEVLAKIEKLNKDDHTHGILIQRPIPEHLSEHQIMYKMNRQKHVEEYTRGEASNIAVDGVSRLLDAYQVVWLLDLHIIVLGGTNIITPAFKAELKRRFQNVEMLSSLEEMTVDRKRNTVVMTELNKGGIIKPTMLGPNVKLIIDLGFDVDNKIGDLDPMVQEIEHLIVVPTPGGVLPILLWLMMERTIKAFFELPVFSVSRKKVLLDLRLLLNRFAGRAVIVMLLRPSFTEGGEISKRGVLVVVEARIVLKA